VIGGAWLELRSKVISLLWGAGGIALFVVFWWAISVAIGRERLPPPPEVIRQLYEIFIGSPMLASRGGVGTVVPHLVNSVAKYLVGVVVGVTLGIGLGLLMKCSATVHDIVIIPVEGIRTVPALAFTPFLLLWFGPTALAVVFLVIIYISLMLVISTVNAIDNVPRIYLEFAKTLGTTERQLFRSVVLPAILPELRGGIRVAISRSWGLVIVAELMGSPLGLGKALTVVTPYFAISTIIALIIVTTALANITDICFLVATRRISRWAPQYEEH